MRLTALRIRRYGPFDDLQLKLDAAPGRLNLICAPNGAGKSVLRQAFSDLLFGIGGKSPMAFRFRNTANMHLAATGLAANGAALAFGRRKGHGNTLTDEAGAPLDAVALAASLGGTDQAALERLFALDTERLRLGGSRLMASGGLVADALLSAGGLGTARDVRRVLEAQAELLAPARRSEKRPFYAAADSFVAARKAASAALLKPEIWEHLSHDIAEAEAALAAARQKAAVAQAEMTRLQRLRRVRPALAALDASEHWLACHPDAPSLPASLRQRLDDAIANLRAALDKMRAETLRRDGLHASLDAIPHDPALLAQAPAIDLLAEHAGAVGKALEDLPARAAELTQIEARIEARLRSLGAPGADPQKLVPARAAITHTRTLIRGHGEHSSACRAASEAREKLARQIAAHEAQPAPALADTGPLAALIDEIRAQGDPAAQAREAADHAAKTHAALSRALAETPFWLGREADLRALTLPAMPVLETAHATLAASEAALARDQDALAAAETRLREAEIHRHHIVGDGIVPDRDAVAAARQQRTALWDLVARTAFGNPPGPAELAALGSTPLALAYERAVADADTLADRRADESSLIERAALAETQLSKAAEAVTTLQARLDASRGNAARATAAWQTLLPATLPPTCRLDDMRAFTAARARVIERWEEAENARQAAANLAARHAEWTQRLAAALHPGLPDRPPLNALLAEARRTVEAAAEAERRAATFRATLRQLSDQHRAAEAACHHAEAARGEWQADWATALATLGRPPGEIPAVTDDILGVLAELDTDLNRAASLSTRIADMRADNAGFTARTEAVAAAGSPGLGAPPDAAAALVMLRQLRQAVSDARECDARRRTLHAQREQADRQLTELTTAHTQREADLAAILGTIGAATPEDAELRLAQADERARAETARHDATARLREDSDGVDTATLRAALATLTADDVARDLYTAEAEARAAQDAAEALAARLAVLRRDLAERESQTSYDDAIQAQNAAAATAGRVLREAAVARLAACLLGAAMDLVEKQATPVMLRAIGAWFTRLTNGAYSEVSVDQTADGAALSLTEAAFPDERREVGELSEGTRDQLFLALRLAALESHPVRLPFIADDILQTADDIRAEAALRALMTLSHTTQVILLTHHRHIAALAERMFPGAVHQMSLVDPVILSPDQAAV